MTAAESMDAFAALAIAVSLAISFAPYLVARARAHREKSLVLALNAAVTVFVLLSPVLGVAVWIVCLLWACLGTVVVPPAPPKRSALDVRKMAGPPTIDLKRNEWRVS